MQRVDLGETELRVWQRGGSLLMDATTKYYRQWSAKSELLQVCYHGGCAWLNGVLVAKWGGIPGVTHGLRIPWVAKRTGDANMLLFPGIGVGSG